MEKIRIITDSAADIPQDNIYGITVLPMSIRFGDTEYKDGIDLTPQEFYEKLVESDQLPTTSLISPATFEEAYKTAIDNGEKVVVITVSSNLSGTYQSAVLAASEYPDDVYVVDSKNVAVGEHIVVMLAARLLNQGFTAKEIAEKLQNEKDNIHVLAVLDTLEYLKKGGRISSTVAFVGGALNLKPVVAVVDGKVEMIGKARGSKNGNNYLVKEIENTSGVDFTKPLCLGYAGLDDALLQKYIEDSSRLWEGHKESMEVTLIGAAIGTHCGPGTIAVAFFAK
jgi:DegV family protein with EDD domain